MHTHTKKNINPNSLVSAFQTQLTVAASAQENGSGSGPLPGLQGEGDALSVCRVFDGYRTLKRDLEAAGLRTVEPHEDAARLVSGFHDMLM